MRSNENGITVCDRNPSRSICTTSILHNLRKVDVLGEHVFDVSCAGVRLQGMSLYMRRRLLCLNMHAPAKLRGVSESTRWMDLLIHWPTWQKLQKKVAHAQPSNWRLFQRQVSNKTKITYSKYNKKATFLKKIFFFYFSIPKLLFSWWWVQTITNKI